MHRDEDNVLAALIVRIGVHVDVHVGGCRCVVEEGIAAVGMHDAGQVVRICQMPVTLDAAEKVPILIARSLCSGFDRMASSSRQSIRPCLSYPYSVTPMDSCWAGHWSDAPCDSAPRRAGGVVNLGRAAKLTLQSVRDPKSHARDQLVDGPRGAGPREHDGVVRSAFSAALSWASRYRVVM